MTRAVGRVAAAALALLVIEGCSRSTTSHSPVTTIASTWKEAKAEVVFASDVLIDASDTWSGPRPLTIQRQTSGGMWQDVRTIDGPLTELATLPDGDDRLWDYDQPLGEFSVTRA